MGQFGYNELVLSKACLFIAADATNIITVGNVRVPAVAYADGASIDALSADAWTDVQDVNLGTPFQFQIGTAPSSIGFLYIILAAETAGDYVRVQYELDGTAVMDITVGPSKTQTVYGLFAGAWATNVPCFPMFAKSRFRVRLYKHGTIDQGGSVIRTGVIFYQEVVL